VATTISFKHTDMELRQAGIEALLQALGYAETLRFLSQAGSGQGDYLQWREHLFEGATVDEIFERAKDYCAKEPKDDGVPDAAR
jgi:hypothetical protein